MSCDTAGKEVRLWNTGPTWKLFDLGTEAVARCGYPYLTVFRPDLLKALTDAVRALRPQALHLGRSVTGVAESGRVTPRFVDGGTAAGDAVVGADGGIR